MCEAGCGVMEHCLTGRVPEGPQNVVGLAKKVIQL